MWYREHVSKVYQRSGNMLEADTAVSLPGFSTVYAFSEEHAAEIRSSGSSKGLSRFPVFSDRVIFDFDDGWNSASKLVSWLTERDLGYDLYESGGKGFHVLTAHNPIYDVNLPFTHRTFAQSIGVSCDTTLFQHGRLLRNPGTIHEKTGKPKVLVEQHEGGSILELSIKTPEPTRFSISQIDDEDVSKFFFSEIGNRIGNSPGAGRRHTFFWGLARDAFRTGLSFDATLEILLMLNATWGEDAKDTEYVTRAAEQGWE